MSVNFQRLLARVAVADANEKGMLLSPVEVQVLNESWRALCADYTDLREKHVDRFNEIARLEDWLLDALCAKKTLRKRVAELEAFIACHPNSEFALSEIEKLGLGDK